MGSSSRSLLAVVVYVCLIAFVVGVGYVVWQHVGSDVMKSPFLTVIATIGLLVFIVGAVVIFAQLDLADKTQALALPEGSIRSIVALILLTMFMIIPLTLYSGISSAVQRIEHVPQAEVEVAKKGPLKDRIVASSQEPQANANIPPLYTITYLEDNPAKMNFANQFLTAVITLVSAVSSFFFGAAVAKTAQSGGPSPTPTLQGIDKSEGKAGGDPVDVVITGSDLNTISIVKVDNGKQSVSATGVTSSSGTVKCTLKLPEDLAGGSYDVIATDNTGRSAKLPNAFRVTPRTG